MAFHGARARTNSRLASVVTMQKWLRRDRGRGLAAALRSRCRRSPGPSGSTAYAHRERRPVERQLGSGVSSGHVPAHQPALAEPAASADPLVLAAEPPNVRRLLLEPVRGTVNAPKTVSCPSPWPDLAYTHPNLTGDDIVQGEEAGTLWLCAWPELLDWPRQISWLFSPVTGKYPWPGDLWGVDESGEILVVENKSAPRPSSPFEDFLALERKVATTPCASHTVEKLHAKWSDALAGERAFLESQADTLKSGRGSLTEWRGLAPNSLKRLMVWRWRELYLARIAPLVSDPCTLREPLRTSSGLGTTRGLLSTLVFSRCARRAISAFLSRASVTIGNSSR